MNRKEKLAKMFVVEAIKYKEERASGDSNQMDKQSEIISKIESKFIA